MVSWDVNEPPVVLEKKRRLGKRLGFVLGEV